MASSLFFIGYLLFDLLSGIMHFMRKACGCLSAELNPLYTRHYASKIDWNKLRPIIINRIRNRVNDYPIKSMIPVAKDVLKSQEILWKGVSFLLNVIPVKACNSCPEVYIGKTGHQINTCRGFKKRAKNLPHQWTEGKLIDILPRVESYHLQHMRKSMIKHDQRFDLPRVPAILELCHQAGVEIPDEILYSYSRESYDSIEYPGQVATLLGEDIQSIAVTTLDAWENLRLGLQKLLFVYPVKVCQYCSEIHVGPTGHKVRVCGLFKHESWRGIHKWKRAEVDDLVPPKVVWHRRPQDPPVLADNGRNFYGHAPAVVELCIQAGARVHPKYFCMMKIHGFPGN
ncbi:APO protein 4, mitochondrial-like isoform X1 [Zingiber officinale]|uniref:APO protein 4, mitochondrial-like isoform X1 n=2 Tax=Zingiber officinale TaxID=94328 RepID=UPI001C4CE2A1|nr:APO protein 4, mitochondrial-like isoform X1 [Zingiber officinale]